MAELNEQSFAQVTWSLQKFLGLLGRITGGFGGEDCTWLEADGIDG
jgi:hypothetical protein